MAKKVLTGSTLDDQFKKRMYDEFEEFEAANDPLKATKADVKDHFLQHGEDGFEYMDMRVTMTETVKVSVKKATAVEFKKHMAQQNLMSLFDFEPVLNKERALQAIADGRIDADTVKKFLSHSVSNTVKVSRIK